MENLTINGNVYQPKFNFAFYKQVSKTMANDSQDGFSVLVQDLLAGKVEAIVEAYYHALAYYKRNQPTEDMVEEALSATVFVSDEATENAVDDIIKTMHDDNFLARNLSEFIKTTENSMDIVEAQADAMPDEENGQPNMQKKALETSLKSTQEQLNRLKTLTNSGSTQSPMDDKSESAQAN